MSLKKFLFLPLLISLGLFAYYSEAVERSLNALQESVPFSAGLATALLTAALFQIMGHIVRALKMRLLMEPVTRSTVRFQFRALSVGYLFNALLPFRLGELVRAQIIAGAEKISFGYALSLIVVERIVDALLLALVSLLLLIPLGVASHQAVGNALFLLFIAIAAALLVALIVRQNIRLFRLWHRVTAWFNPAIENSLRFKAWSIVYGLQQTLTRKRAAAYLGLTLVSWTFYALSIFTVASYLLPSQSFPNKLGMAAAPYYGVSVPAGPANLGVYSKIANTYTSGLPLSPQQRLDFNLLSWAVLIVPISLIGLVFFFVKTPETLWRRLPKKGTSGSVSNKLQRTEDISQDMAAFLDNYFSGNSLSHIVHRLERKDNFRLLKYFKGGSDAITILALQDGREIVKKIIPLEFEDRLKAQYDWLAQYKERPGIVTVLGEEKTADYYAIDLDYDPENEMFYEYMHRHPLKRSTEVLDTVWKHLFTDVYGRIGKMAEHKDERQAYIDKHIFGCLEKAAAVDPQLVSAAAPEKLVINGKEYDNLYQIMDKIRQHPQAWKDIATYRQTTAVHGDVIVDNLLVSRKDHKVLIIDPAPDGNIINGPVFDFGKNMQSLHPGYESLLRDEDPVYLVNGNEITYRDYQSERYKQLAGYVKKELAPKYLKESEQRAMLFHAAALYIRRLKHQVYYTPANALKFYAVGVKTLNDFLAQYERRDP